MLVVSWNSTLKHALELAHFKNAVFLMENFSPTEKLRQNRKNNDFLRQELPKLINQNSHFDVISRLFDKIWANDF